MSLYRGKNENWLWDSRGVGATPTGARVGTRGGPERRLPYAMLLNVRPQLWARGMDVVKRTGSTSAAGLKRDAMASVACAMQCTRT